MYTLTHIHTCTHSHSQITAHSLKVEFGQGNEVSFSQRSIPVTHYECQVHLGTSTSVTIVTGSTPYSTWVKSLTKISLPVSQDGLQLSRTKCVVNICVEEEEGMRYEGTHVNTWVVKKIR